uniref:Class II aldolase/adducin N-terminal domain-containing protein n=1 Tax=Odontella aurita TaxID=265563 RepID=A0A7S4M8D1_9STRA
MLAFGTCLCGPAEAAAFGTSPSPASTLSSVSFVGARSSISLDGESTIFRVRLSATAKASATDAMSTSSTDLASYAAEGLNIRFTEHQQQLQREKQQQEPQQQQQQLRQEEEEEETYSLNAYPDPPPGCPFSPAEWKQRCALAVSYRAAFMEDWHMNIFNHITLKVEGSDAEPSGPHFLLNDYGMGFDEITASSLLKVTLDGTQVGPSRGRVFKPGYVLHSAVHGARDDVHAVWHCHHIDATAVCQTKTGLLPLSQEATFALAKGLSYHPYEGSANSEEERPRIIANLGPTNKVLILEDHGPLVAGENLEEAFSSMWFLTRACQYQVRSTSSVGGDLSRIHVPCEETRDEMDRRAEKFDEAPAIKVECKESGEENEVVEKHDTEGLMFACARRAAERKFGAENVYI